MISKIKADEFHIDAAAAVLRSADYERFLTARQMVEAARADAKAIRAQAKKDHARAREQGYQKGIEQAQHDLVKRHVELVAKAIEYTAALEGEIFDLIKTMLTKITGQMDIDRLTKHIIEKTLAEYGTLPELKLQISPKQKEMVENLLGEIARKNSRADRARFVTIEADEHVQPGECILESPIGSVDASLDVQLAALKAVLDHAPRKTIDLKQEAQP